MKMTSSMTNSMYEEVYDCGRGKKGMTVALSSLATLEIKEKIVCVYVSECACVHVYVSIRVQLQIAIVTIIFLVFFLH